LSDSAAVVRPRLMPILRSNPSYPHGESNPGYHLERVVS
jgi:hypothetical protein